MVRASRDGHEFHEAWAARKALQLVMPTDNLIGIAVEGLAPSDESNASAETVEIADLTLYYGEHPTFSKASSVVIVQVKYSISSETKPFRVSDAKKTVEKFALAFKNFKAKYKAEDVESKLRFELLTNRPIFSGFEEAIAGIVSGELLKGDAKKQAKQFESACGFNGEELIQFARKIRIIGQSGNLRENKQSLSRTLADWSVAPDAMARARLGTLRQMLRDKAGLAGEGRNIITRIDVLDALELQGPEDLFPCPASFPEVGIIVEREQLSTAISLIPKLEKPLLIHASGGIGKTVFLQSIAKSLSVNHKVILFDCFGGGAYRAPEDARHLPKRGLIHIINTLACDGLCDPLLPINEHIEDLIKAFRARLTQAVTTIQRDVSGKQLFLFIDAIDNAAEQAKDRGENAFPKLLLESFHHSGPVAGVRLIVSCRTHRRDVSRADIPCEELELKPFSEVEVQKYLRDRILKVTTIETQVAYSRSGGNPRILEHLALSDRGLLNASEANKVIILDDLLNLRIQKALREASKRGYKEKDINSFLAGLSVLPPPVPIDEYADANSMDISAVESFSADLAPLLERTKFGLMFRDEPTETLIRETYAANTDALSLLTANLFKKQDVSVYAASALPRLLQKLDDGKQLFKLAFDDRFPVAITSSVGKQNIRYARLKAAVLHAANKADFDKLVHLLVELSTLAAINQRGADYVLDNPDLVIASNDIDATRRLIELRTQWPGTRHARLTIASVLSGDINDASRHATQANEWIRHFYRQHDEYRRGRSGPEKSDIASIPLWLIAQNKQEDAVRFLSGWKAWYAYEVSEELFSFLHLAENIGAVSFANISRFLASLKSHSGIIASALSFVELDNSNRSRLIKVLAKSCKKENPLLPNKDFHRKSHFLLQDGFLKAASIAVTMELREEANTIASSMSFERPHLWSLTDNFSNNDAFPYITFIGIQAAIQQQSISELMLLPKELVDSGTRVSNGLSGEPFRKALKADLEQQFKSQNQLPDDKKSMSYESKERAERFIDGRLEPLLNLVQAFTATISAPLGGSDQPFLYLLDLWTKLRLKREHYSDYHKSNLFFDFLGRQVLTFLLWTRSDLNPSSVEKFVSSLTLEGVASASMLVEITSILSKKINFHELAGQTAIKAKSLIECEDEVEYRASLFAQLSRAIMPASIEEAALYFRSGLEQMDAIGSGDYQFTNELLLFSAELSGSELDGSDFHTLSNICELNMSSEEEKFPWFAFGNAMARISGCRGLAKLGRWEDREKVSLDYTLLPYLSNLIEQDKIDPSLALSLLRLSDPAELYASGTEQLAEIIKKKHFPNSKELFSELILQFEQNHPGVFMPSTLNALSKLAEQELGRNSEQSIYLSTAAPKFRKLNDVGNEHRNYHGTANHMSARNSERTKNEYKVALQKIEEVTEPNNETSMSQAIDSINELQYSYELRSTFFENLRKKLQFSDRTKYIQTISRLENLGIYAKIKELKDCKEAWGNSLLSIQNVFREIGVPLVQIHAEDFVSNDYLSGSNLKEIADLSGIEMPILALELITIFADPDSNLPASIWMSLAAIICKQSKSGNGQAALKRLLNSNAAKLASTVTDGAWNANLYPVGEQAEITAGLIWLMLGSPRTSSRWRAAHSIRCLAKFGKWEVIDLLINKFNTVEAYPYQASETPFFFLHARLWLLIGLARVALDYPQYIAKYADKLKLIAFDNDTPHVLMRHFATQALLVCTDSSHVTLSMEDANSLRAVNKTQLPIKKTKSYPNDFYKSRPKSMPEPELKFSLDYDFDKSEVTRLASLFDKSRFETQDAITKWVRKYDLEITSMYESGGRSNGSRDRMRGINSRYHLYGEQLALHALYLVSGEFLSKYPVIQRQYDEYNSWEEWLKEELLSRNDGLWLADGVDWPPIDAQINLYEKGKKGVVLTGNKNTLLSLLNINSVIDKNLVVAGNWSSADNIGIHISSALIPPEDSKNMAIKLSKEDPFQAWLPHAEEYDDSEEFYQSRHEPYKPWIVWPSTEAKLDSGDPLGSNSAIQRLYFSKAINSLVSINPVDPFKRYWTDQKGNFAAKSEAWGYNNSRLSEDNSINCNRLVCNTRLLMEVLEKQQSELLLLIILRKYESGFGSRDGQFWHTTAVIRVDKSLDFEFYPGVINKLHKTKY